MLFFIYLFLAVWSFIVIVPLYWMTISSFKVKGDIFNLKFSFFPQQFTVTGFSELLNNTLFLRWSFNTILVGIGTAVIGVIICSLAGFTFAKYEFKGKNFLFFLVLSSVMIPLVVNIIPIYVFMNKLKLLNTYLALILPLCPNAFVVFFIRSYITSIPSSLLDAARVDGCSEFKIFLKIIVPLAKPAISAGFIFLFMDQWIQYFWPLIMTNTSKMAPLTIGLASIYADVFNIKYDVLMAGATLSVVPMIAAFVLAQKQFITGLTGGAIKG
ncbi:MAG: carbohydrate ABC transporter permease [Candidatus Atribacteria bacterium]|nr:carbohydrate ABC transporter permease [Candidatus Atribacteria bacterium]